MLKKLRHIGTTGKLATILILLVMVPAIFFSAYEFSSLSRNESLIADIYSQQLDVVLFSLNQYAWDIVNSWATTVSDALRNRPSLHQYASSDFRTFLNENVGIHCMFLADSTTRGVQVFYPDRIDPADRIDPGAVRSSLRTQGEIIERLFRLQATGYRKIEPLTIAESSGRKSLALMFIRSQGNDSHDIVGIVIDAQSFVREVLGRKMNEVAGDNFLLSVNRKNSDQVIYATGEIQPGEARQTKDLWLFPEYTIGIRVRGETIEEIVRARFNRNALLIGLLNVVLIAGVWVVYRTVRREVELAQMKADFVSNVSHEIKTPLSLIRMYAETLQMKRVQSGKQQQEYYDTIVQETERLTRLINNILNFSRMEAGRKEYRMESADLGDIVRGVVGTYQAHLEHEGFEVTTEIAKNLPAIHADKESLSEALLNIIDNAVKYSTDRKYIRISTGTGDGVVFVEVQDRGIGIDQRQQDMIFEKFYRVSSGLVHNTKGSGLGLALVKHIVDAHKGTITVRSKPEEGSTFRISFPAHPDSAFIQKRRS